MPATPNQSYADYPIFKGLQMPLEFMGLRGRYIYWAAAAVIGAILGFVIAYVIGGFLAGLVVLVSVVAVGSTVIFVKQQRGLHTKRVYHGVLIYHTLHNL